MSRLVTPRPAGPTTAQSGGGDDYLSRVAKYVPSEIVVAYLTAQGLIVASAPADPRPYYAAVALVLLVVTPLYLRRLAQPGQPVVRQMVISTLALPFWAYALAELPEAFGVYNALAASLALIAFSLVVGLVQPVEGES